MKQRVLLRGAVAAALAVLLSGCGGYNWLQWGGGPAHSGQNLGERSITLANVSTLAPTLRREPSGRRRRRTRVPLECVDAERRARRIVRRERARRSRRVRRALRCAALEGHLLGEHVPDQQHRRPVLYDVVTGDRSERKVRLRLRARRQGAQGRDRHRRGSDRRALARAQHAEGFRREGFVGAVDRDRAQRDVVSLLDALRLSR